MDEALADGLGEAQTDGSVCLNLHDRLELCLMTAGCRRRRLDLARPKIARKSSRALYHGFAFI
jgi:hypothetical protein